MTQPLPQKLQTDNREDFEGLRGGQRAKAHSDADLQYNRRGEAKSNRSVIYRTLQIIWLFAQLR